MIQFILSTILTISTYFIISISFSIIYIVCSFFHFAHAIIFTFGAYFTFLLFKILSIPIIISITIAILLCALLGVLIEITIYRPIRGKTDSSLILLISSLGIGIVLQNIISLSFGDDTKTLRTGIVKEGIEVFGAYITPIQIIIIITAITTLFFVLFFMKKTRLGRSMRAVASDPQLAKISGIDSDRVILWAFAIGSGLAGLVGILYALDVDMTPTMGMPMLLMGVVAMIIGGIDSIPGIATGSLLLGFSQHFGAYYIGSQWKDAIAFIILLVFLLLRPQGFLGKKIKKAEI